MACPAGSQMLRSKAWMSDRSAVAACSRSRPATSTLAQQQRVEPGGADEPIEVDDRHGVEVHDSDVLDSGCGEPQGDVEADAAGADDEHAKPGEVGLGLWSPR
jgi:hypothetical protein